MPVYAERLRHLRRRFRVRVLYTVSANGGADILLAVGHPGVTVRSSCPDSPPAPAAPDLLNDRVS